jgi:spore maturation protein CgeB
VQECRLHLPSPNEPEYSWSYQSLIANEGEQFLAEFEATYPHLRSIRYRALDLAEVLVDVQLAIVHEWNPPDLITEIGTFRAKNSSFRLLFRDSDHRAVTQPATIARLDLSGYDGVLAYGTRKVAELPKARPLVQNRYRLSGQHAVKDVTPI